MKRPPLTLGDRFAICNSLSLGVSRKDVAEKFKIHPQTVYKIFKDKESIFKAIEDGADPSKRFIKHAKSSRPFVRIKEEPIFDGPDETLFFTDDDALSHERFTRPPLDTSIDTHVKQAICDRANGTCPLTGDDANSYDGLTRQPEAIAIDIHVKKEETMSCNNVTTLPRDDQHKDALQQLDCELDSIAYSELFNPEVLGTEENVEILDISLDSEPSRTFDQLFDDCDNKVQPVIEARERTIDFNQFLSSLEVLLNYTKQQNETQWHSVLNKIKFEAIEKHLIDIVQSNTLNRDTF